MVTLAHEFQALSVNASYIKKLGCCSLIADDGRIFKMLNANSMLCRPTVSSNSVALKKENLAKLLDELILGYILN